MRAILLIGCVALAGCATTSDVYELDGGRYGLASSAYTTLGGAGQARASSIKRATAYCSARGQKAVIEDAKSDATFASGTSEITFRCESP
jgi:hypothetical protein